MDKIDKITPRSRTRQVLCGGVPIGGGVPIPIQSMTNTFTEDAAATVLQIGALARAGADIVRLAVPTPKAAVTLREILERIDAAGVETPIVADVHFDYKIALESIKAGVHKIRINPGNIGKTDRVKAIADMAGAAGIPIRIGVNGGSIEDDLLGLYETEPAKALAESALRNIALMRSIGFEDIVVSVKASDVFVTAEAHRILATSTDLPLHIGITEAGFGMAAIVKSSVGIGALLEMGIGDTIRVSLTGNPVDEIPIARDILRSVKLLPGRISLISCPTCGRCRVDLAALCGEAAAALYDVELKRVMASRHMRRYGMEQGETKEGFVGRLRSTEKPITVAIMGCAVNGPGEASHADFGVACGRYGGMLFKKGVKGDVIPTDKIPETLVAEALALTVPTSRPDSV